MKRGPITRAQALRWNADWSYADRELIDGLFDQLAVTSFLNRGNNIRCSDPSDRMLMTVDPGFLQFAKGRSPFPPNKDGWDGVELSTFRPHAHSATKRRAVQDVCPDHLMERSVSGVCPLCD